jgi:long-chain acyl-CoA synthetase
MFYYQLIASHPADRPALLDQDRVITYGELREQVDRWAAFLQEAGLKKGERVGLFSRNCAEYVAAYMAVIRAGGVIVPINFQLVPREVAYMIKDAEIHLFLTQAKLELDGPLAELGCAPVRQLTFGELDAPVSGSLQEVPRTEDDNCTIIYTSGTTGRPKGAMLSHKNLVANAWDFQDAIHARPEDVILCLLPMYHCYAWSVCVSLSLLLGAQLVIQANYNFKTAIRLVQRHGVTLFTGVPAVMELLLEGAEPSELSTVREFICGGASLGKVLGQKFADKFGHPVLEGYGLSEAAPVVSVNRPGNVKFGSIGLPLVEEEVRILNPQGREVPQGEAGEVVVRGPNVMLGYLNRLEATKETLAGGWLHTGDVGYADEDGFIFLVDRLKDMIISSGENVYPREVEEAITQYPGIREASVVGVADRLRGQAITAFLVLQEGAQCNPKELRRYLLGRIAPYKVPREYFIIQELPKTSLGKVRKNILRQQAEEILQQRRMSWRSL